MRDGLNVNDMGVDELRLAVQELRRQFADLQVLQAENTSLRTANALLLAVDEAARALIYARLHDRGLVKKRVAELVVQLDKYTKWEGKGQWTEKGKGAKPWADRPSPT